MSPKNVDKKAEATGHFRKLGVIGAGVMGQALIRGLMAKGVVRPENVWAAARRESSCAAIREELSVAACTDYVPALADTDVLLIAVKPGSLKGVLEKLRKSSLPPDTLILSIVAGQSIPVMEQTLDGPWPVV